MAQATKPIKAKAKSKAGEKKPSFHEIEQLFSLSRAEKVKGRDGKVYEIFHRTGAVGGAYSKNEFMEKLGYKRELSMVEKDAQKRYSSLSDVRSVVDGRRVKILSVLNSRISGFKIHMNKLYAEGQNKLIPLIASVRIHSESEERKFFIQGFVNSDGEFVIGNRDDAALWAIEVMSGARGMASKYKLATLVGRDLTKRAGIAGPIRDRLESTLKG